MREIHFSGLLSAPDLPSLVINPKGPAKNPKQISMVGSLTPAEDESQLDRAQPEVAIITNNKKMVFEKAFRILITLLLTRLIITRLINFCSLIKLFNMTMKILMY